MEEIALNLPFFIAGLIVFIGFFGTLLFQKTRVPDVLFLIAIGVIIGPVTGWIDAKQLDKITPYFSRLALIIILFEGGLHLSFDALIKHFIGAIGLSLGTFILSLSGTAAICFYLFEMSLINSLLLGCILGCTSPAVIISLITKMNAKEETKSIISIESVLTEILAIISVIVLIEIALIGQTRPATIMNAIVGPFSIGLVFAVIMGLIWIRVLSKVKSTALSYMTTLASVLVLFGLVEMCKGSGAVAAFTFGLVLRNGTRFLKVFDENKTFNLDVKIDEFHGEITFFIRTYFFVYLGLLVSLDLFKRWDFFEQALLISASLIMVRYLFVWFFSLSYKPIRNERFTIFVMLPRGLASAVIASLPAASKIQGTNDFINYTILVILLSNIFMVMGIFISEKLSTAQSKT